jgi:FtsH ternary system domain X3-analog
VAELLIILKRDPNTGKQNIVVKLESEPDALPIEHEQLHKKIVEKLVGKGLKAEDLGQVIITRDGEAQQIGPIAQPSTGEREKVAGSE